MREFYRGGDPRPLPLRAVPRHAAVALSRPQQPRVPATRSRPGDYGYHCLGAVILDRGLLRRVRPWALPLRAVPRLRGGRLAPTPAVSARTLRSRSGRSGARRRDVQPIITSTSSVPLDAAIERDCPPRQHAARTCAAADIRQRRAVFARNTARMITTFGSDVQPVRRGRRRARNLDTLKSQLRTRTGPAGRSHRCRQAQATTP